MSDMEEKARRWAQLHALTPRETEHLVQIVVFGRDIEQTAHALAVSSETANQARKRLYRKFDVSGVQGLCVAFARFTGGAP